MTDDDSAALQDAAMTDDRRIDPDRLTRALTEPMTVTPTAPLQFAVVHDDARYEVDIEMGTCECEDYRFRGGCVYCKHVLRACVHGVFTDGVRTRLQARVVTATRELGCPHDHGSITAGAGCEGPLGRGTFPCPACVAATPGEWSAWTTLMDLRARGGEEGRGRERDAPTPDAEPVAATDGGLETHRVWIADCQHCGWQSAHDDKAAAEDVRCAHEDIAHDGDPTWHTATVRWEDVETDGGQKAGDEQRIMTDGGRDQPEDVVNPEYRPLYEYDPDARLRKQIKSNVPVADQLNALRTIQGDGAVEPEGWARSYNEYSVPVIDGVPIILLGDRRPVASGREGAESWTRHAVEDVGQVEVHHAGRHPTNVSKVLVKPAAEPEDDDTGNGSDR